MARMMPHPAKVLEGLGADDSGQVLDNDTEARLLQLCTQSPHLLGPLDFWETAEQLLSAAQHGHCSLHILNANSYKRKKLSRCENKTSIKHSLLQLSRTFLISEGLVKNIS